MERLLSTLLKQAPNIMSVFALIQLQLELDYTFFELRDWLFRQLACVKRSIETKMFIVFSRDISHVLLNKPNARIMVRILDYYVQEF